MSKWISVDDRLPEVGEIDPASGYEYGAVLVYDGEDVYEEFNLKELVSESVEFFNDILNFVSSLLFILLNCFLFIF